MAKVCDGRHEHEPWGQVWSDGKWTWATKLECEYSAGLCEAIAEEATKNLSGHILPTPKPQIARRPPGRDPRLTEVRAAAGRQTRHAHRTNVPNQKKASTLSFDVDYHTDLIPGKIKQDTVIGLHTIPKGSVVESVAQKKMAKGGSDTWRVDIRMQEAWTTQEFIKATEQVTLPWRERPGIPDRSLENIVQALTMGVEAYDEKWARNIEILARRAASFKDIEKQAREGTAEWTQKVSGRRGPSSWSRC